MADIFMATDTDTTIEDAMFSIRPLLGNGAVNVFTEMNNTKE
jgi:hypothetical protein